MPKRKRQLSIGGPEPPHGVVPQPTGGFTMPGATGSVRTDKQAIHVEAVYRDHPNMRQFARALIMMAKRELAEEAERQKRDRSKSA